MSNNNIKFVNLVPIIFGLLLLGGCGDTSNDTATSVPQSANETSPGTTTTAQQVGDVIARVGDETITFSLLNTMLNSSAMVGLSIPAFGTPERNQTIITLLDKAISANLLYLDALKKGSDKKPDYQQDIRRFEDAILAGLYREQFLYSDIEVSEEEIQEDFKNMEKDGGELTDDTRMAIRSRLRNAKLKKLKDGLRSHVREGVLVSIEQDVLEPGKDDARSDGTVVARADNREITWREVREIMAGADKRAESAEFYLDSDIERRKRLDVYIDSLVMANKGRAAGLESDPTYVKRTTEYRKMRLINLHRSQLVSDWAPSDEELKVFFEANKDKITVPEMRKVQMVVLKTREEAEDIKQKIDAGEMTIFQAARDYSIDPNAKRTLGEMGWVKQGTGFPELDEFTFFQEPDVLGGPVESAAGWHLVKVLDVQDPQMQYLEEPQAQRTTMRMYNRETLDNYVIELRKSHFQVVVYEDELARQFKREAEFMAQLNKKAAQEGSVTKQRQEDLQKWITPPQQ